MFVWQLISKPVVIAGRGGRVKIRCCSLEGKEVSFLAALSLTSIFIIYKGLVKVPKRLCIITKQSPNDNKEIECRVNKIMKKLHNLR